MEASSSRHGVASVAGRPAGGGRRRSSSVSGVGSIHSLSADLLCGVFALLDHFELVRCSAVCKSWNSIIYKSSLMRDLYYNKNPHVSGNSNLPITSETSMKMYLEELAMEQHRSAFLSKLAKVHQWNGHAVRVNTCRMKRGMILTGVGDKVLRLWSAESCQFLDEYSLSDMNSLIDYDFDENKIVGLDGSRMCIWRRHGQRSIFKSHEGIFSRGLCMCYIDPEAVIGCEDGRARIFDMYSGRCSRIIRIHSGPVTCLALTDDQLVLGGNSFGTVAIADLLSGERLGSLRSSFAPTGMRSLCFNKHSLLVFGGSTSGYVHCWDLRTLRPLWETRVSPNVIYTTHHLSNDTSTLAVGGLDGVLRILNQNTGEVLTSFVTSAGNTIPVSSRDDRKVVENMKARALCKDTQVDSIPRNLRPPITCLTVGMKKIVTTHNEKFIRVWRFHE